MNLETIKPALKELFQALSGFPTVWENEPRPYNPGALTILNYTAIASVGIDEGVTTQDLNQPQGQELADEYRGVRQVTLTVKIEALDQTDAGNAYQALERVREQLPFRGTGEALRAVNCALSRVMSTEDLTEALDDRQESIAALDLILTVRTSTPDPTRYGYIATVAVTGILTVPGGGTVTVP